MSILKELEKKLPSDAGITEVKFEGSEIVLYTKNPDFFRTGEQTIKEIVKGLKKRVELRPDLSISIEPEKAKRIIIEIVPEEAGIKEIYFEPELGKVIIEAQKPGLIIGKGGDTYKRIKNETLWLPKIERAPAIKSDVVRAVRNLLHSEIPYRKKFLNMVGQKINTKVEVKETKNNLFARGENGEWLRISTLGGFRQVGRSCLLVQTSQSMVLLDCGVDVSTDQFPYINAPEFDMEKLDAIVLSHAHLDHSGFIPYLYDQGYTGPLYCTPPTRDLMVLLCMDYIDVAQKSGRNVPYGKKAIEKTIKHSIALEYGEVSDIATNIRLTFQPAGHILGSSLVHLHVGEGFHNILYSGDIKYTRTRLFEPAFTDFQRIETLIIESTYGSSRSQMPTRKEAEDKLFDCLNRTIERGGKALIPSFAVGRSQEIAVTLAQNNFQYPIYVEGMVWDSTAIHTAYPEYLSERLQKDIFHYSKNPFVSENFKFVAAKERADIIDSGEPGVIIATSGMLIGGPSVEYLKAMAPDKKNMLLFAGYQAEGTLGRRIQKGWTEIPIHTGEGKTQTVDLKLEVDTLNGFSGHSDRNQMMKFISNLASRPERIICNHGDSKVIMEFSRDIHRIFNCESLAPKNLEAIRLK